MSNMDIKGVLTFESIPGATRMRWFWDLEPRGFYKMLGPLIRRIGERQELQIWSELKTVMETGRPARNISR